jgi:hypothetical protein
MNKSLLGLSILFLAGCAEPEPVYVEHPVVVEHRVVVHHVYEAPPADSDEPSDFRAVEKPSTYSQ